MWKGRMEKSSERSFPGQGGRRAPQPPLSASPAALPSARPGSPGTVWPDLFSGLLLSSVWRLPGWFRSRTLLVEDGWQSSHQASSNPRFCPEGAEHPQGSDPGLTRAAGQLNQLGSRKRPRLLDCFLEVLENSFLLRLFQQPSLAPTCSGALVSWASRSAPSTPVGTAVPRSCEPVSPHVAATAPRRVCTLLTYTEEAGQRVGLRAADIVVARPHRSPLALRPGVSGHLCVLRGELLGGQHHPVI